MAGKRKTAAVARHDKAATARTAARQPQHVAPSATPQPAPPAPVAAFRSAARGHTFADPGQRAVLAAAETRNAAASLDAAHITPSEIRQLTSLLLERRNFAYSVGMQFGGRRDMYEALGYPRELTTSDYRQLYERGGIAERIVEAFPRATWAGGAAVIEDGTISDNTPWEDDVEQLFIKHNLWARILRADILAQLGQYGILLIGAPGDMALPLGRLSSPDSLLYFNSLPDDRARVAKFVTSTSDPRFGLPETYSIDFGPRRGVNGTSAARTVHWSRVIHLAEGLLEDDVFGKPRLRSIYNYFLDLDKNVGGGSEAAWKRMDPGMQVDVDPTVDMSEEDEDALSDEVEDLIHGMRRFIRTRGTKVTPLSASVTAFGANATSVLQLIAATTGIPFRILLGSERGELASTQDRNNWSNRIAERRREFAIPAMRLLLDRLIKHGALPKPKAGKYEIVWPNIESLDEPTKAVIVSQYTAANRDQATVTGRVLVTTNEIRNVLGLGPIESLKDEETKAIPPAVPGRGQSSVPGGRTTDVPHDSSAPGEPIPGRPKPKPSAKPAAEED